MQEYERMKEDFDQIYHFIKEQFSIFDEQNVFGCNKKDKILNILKVFLSVEIKFHQNSQRTWVKNLFERGLIHSKSLFLSTLKSLQIHK